MLGCLSLPVMLQKYLYGEPVHWICVIWALVLSDDKPLVQSRAKLFRYLKRVVFFESGDGGWPSSAASTAVSGHVKAFATRMQFSFLHAQSCSQGV